MYEKLYTCTINCASYFPQEYFGPERKGRISLDVDIEGPVLLIPKHAFSPDLMVGDIGHVKVTNSTRYVGGEHPVIITTLPQMPDISRG